MTPGAAGTASNGFRGGEELLYPLGRGCCGARDSGVCHQYGLCRMKGIHPTVTPPTAEPPDVLRRRVEQVIEIVETSERYGHPKVRGYQTPAMREVLGMLRRALDGKP